MDKRGISIKKIHSYLLEFTNHVSMQNESGKFDINKDSEYTAISILNAVFEYELKNANNVFTDNFPAIDLIDDKKSIAIQITSTSDKEKEIKTINKFIDNKFYDKYKDLSIFILSKKERRNKNSREEIDTLINKKFSFKVFDIFDLGKKINNLTDLQHILYIESILETEFGQTNNKIDLLKSEKNDLPKYRFNYRNESTPFLGRETEISELKEFYDRDEHFSWWIISGRAGSGKSRLALEFAHRIESLGGNSGFLLSSQINTVNWEYNSARPQFVIIDYVQSQSDAVLGLIRRLSIKKNYKYKFRLLLIEREVSGDWWNPFTNDYYVSKSMYKGSPLEVSGLDTDLLFNIIERIAKGENPECKLDQVEVIKSFEIIDPLKRPLYAMFVGLALAKEQIITRWNQYDLLNFVIDSNIKLTKHTFKNYSEALINNHLNLAAVATVCYGLTGYDIDSIFEKNLTWLPKPDEFDLELYSFITDGSIVERDDSLTRVHRLIRVNGERIGDPSSVEKNKLLLSPLLPDIVGEYLVLKVLEKNTKIIFKDKNKVNEFIEISETNHIGYFSTFQRKLIQDFLGHPNTILFIIGNKKSIIDNRGISCDNLLNAMKNLYLGKLEDQEIILNYLKTLTETSNIASDQKYVKDYPERAYQEGCQIMIYMHSENLNKQLEYYFIMKKNTDKFSKNPMIANDVFFYKNDQSHDESMHHIIKMIDDKNDFSENKEKVSIIDARIPHLEALSIDCILQGNNYSDTNSRLNKSLTNRLFYLSSKFTDPRIKVVCLKSFIHHGSKNILDFDSRVNFLFNGILLTPPQVYLIDILQCKIELTEILLNYKISNNKSYDALLIVDSFYKHLVLLEHNHTTMQAIIYLAEIILSTINKYYENGILFTGDLFLEKLNSIHHIFVHLQYNPISEILVKAINLRGNYFI